MEEESKRERERERGKRRREEKKEELQGLKRENESLQQENENLQQENRTLKTTLQNLTQENIHLKEDLKTKEELFNLFVLGEMEEKERTLNEKARQLQQLQDQKATLLAMASDMERDLKEKEEKIRQFESQREGAERIREGRSPCPGITEDHLLCHAYLVYGEAVVSKDQCLGFFDHEEVLRSIFCTSKNQREKRCEGCKKLAAFVHSSLQNDLDQTKMAPLTPRQDETFKEVKEEIKRLKKTQIPVSFLSFPSF